jgi:hypothetical protein
MRLAIWEVAMANYISKITFNISLPRNQKSRMACRHPTLQVYIYFDPAPVPQTFLFVSIDNSPPPIPQAPVSNPTKMGLSGESELLVTVAISLLCLSLCIVSLRCWVRISIKGFGLDDQLMTAGLVRVPDIPTGGKCERNTNIHFYTYRSSILGPVFRLLSALIMASELAIYIWRRNK